MVGTYLTLIDTAEGKSRFEELSEEFMESLKKRIDEYAEKYYKIDRNELFKLVNNIRYGKTNSSV